jgi:hypothetical protein
MRNGLKTLAIVAALAAGTSGAALAQNYGYSCPPGYAFYNGVCQPAATPGGVVGAAVGTAGAIAGGALNTAGAIAGGAVGAATGYPPPPPAGCGPGYMMYSDGRCYPAR